MDQLLTSAPHKNDLTKITDETSKATQKRYAALGQEQKLILAPTLDYILGSILGYTFVGQKPVSTLSFMKGYGNATEIAEGLKLLTDQTLFPTLNFNLQLTDSGDRVKVKLTNRLAAIHALNEVEVSVRFGGKSLSITDRLADFEASPDLRIRHANPALIEICRGVLYGFGVQNSMAFVQLEQLTRTLAAIPKGNEALQPQVTALKQVIGELTNKRYLYINGEWQQNPEPAQEQSPSSTPVFYGDPALSESQKLVAGIATTQREISRLAALEDGNRTIQLLARYSPPCLS